MEKIKYANIVNLNSDQAREIKKKGWCFFTECDGDGSYFRRGFALVNSIGYIVFSKNIQQDDIYGYDELNKIAEYDDGFNDEVQKALSPLEDKCYVFLVRDPARYRFEQIWTNKGLSEAKKRANARYGKYQPMYYNGSDNYNEMHRIIYEYNKTLKPN